MVHARQSVMNIFILILFLSISACGQKPAEEVLDIHGTGEQKTAKVSMPRGGTTIMGTVRWEGAPPSSTIIKMGGNPECSIHAAGKGGATDAKDVLVHNGKVENVFIYIKEGLEEIAFDPPEEPLVISNAKCLYEPRVSGAQVGQPIVFLNNDPALHNIHAHPKINKPFNVGLPTQGSKFTKRFEASEVMISIKCDLHSWMQGWVGVLDHPYFAVSDGEGFFQIENVPPGTYTLEAWHERFGSVRETVRVAESPLEVTFTFTAVSGVSP